MFLLIWKEKFTNTLACIQSELDNLSYRNLILGGDWNCSTCDVESHPMNEILSNF